jgi:hypothetical protein
MPRTIPAAFLVPLLAALLPVTLPAQGIRWTPSFEAALATAKAENRVVVLAFNLAGERANDELVDDHYRDPLLAKLTAHTINVFCSIAAEPRVPGVTPAQQQAAEQRARLEVLKIGPGEDVVAPQHVFVGPDGAVLSSVAWRVTKGELEWAIVDAIRKVDAKFEWQLSAAARAPGKLGFGAVERGQNRKPPTKADVDEALKEVRKARGGLLRSLDKIDVLLRSDEPAAIEFVEATLNGVPPAMLAGSLDTIGLVSPKAYHALVASHTGHREEDVRKAAARALEALAEPKALPALLKQWKVEKAHPVRGLLLRAMASCGPAHKDVLAAIEKVLAKEPEPLVRAHAVLALGLCEDKTRVSAGLGQALRDGSPTVRAAVAFVLAQRRDADFAPRLDEAAHREPEPDTKAWLEAAAKVVRGGSGEAFANWKQRVLGEEPVRTGLQRLGGGAGGGGGGGGGGGEGRSG